MYKQKTFYTFNLPNLSIAMKSLFTGYIMAVGIGLMMAGLQIMLTHGMADGKPGISIDDIVYSYYGNKTGSKLEAKLNGSMKSHAPAEERLTMIKWARNGSDKQEWQEKIAPIVQKRCAMCHGTIPSLPNITKFEVLSDKGKVDEGASISSLARLSHIHLFGISFIFFFVGLIFSFSVGFNKWFKAGLIFFPFFFLIIDVASWWLTKINPNFAWFVIIGGIGYSFSSAVMLFSSLYQMWILPMRRSNISENVLIAEPK